MSPDEIECAAMRASRTHSRGVLRALSWVFCAVTFAMLAIAAVSVVLCVGVASGAYSPWAMPFAVSLGVFAVFGGPRSAQAWTLYEWALYDHDWWRARIAQEDGR